MRTVIQAFTKGQCGSHLLIADAVKVEGLKDMGVLSNIVPAFVRPDRCLQAKALWWGGVFCRGEQQMRPDMMIVEMTAAE